MLRFLYLFISNIIIILFNPAEAKFTEIVNTDKGKVCGEVINTVQLKYPYSAFKGIPYARPPVGYGRRFKHPVEVDPWPGVLNTTKDPNRCPQINADNFNFIGNEDCLYLNVYTPELNFTYPQSRAVMVWIHEGAFMSGGVDSSRYGPDFFMEKDVVIVAMNYRLGPLGFLNFLPEYFDCNNGLKDQSAALRWVKKNIKKFGGDPEKVTIFGESAGAASVEFHRLSPHSRGLFRASIAMSGSALHSWAFSSKKVANNRGWAYVSYALRFWWFSNEHLYSQMINLTPQQLILRSIPLLLYVFDIPFKATVEESGTENPFLIDTPINIYRSKSFSQTPHILGFTKDEAVSILNFIEPIPEIFGRDFTSQMISATTDAMFIADVDRTQQLLVNYSSAPVYYYRNSFDYAESLHKVDGRNLWDGSGHADDIAHFFWVNKKNQRLDPDSDIGKHRHRMVTMWTNFAKYLKPTVPEDKELDVGVDWPESDVSGRYLEIDQELTVRNQRPINERIKSLEKAMNE